MSAEKLALIVFLSTLFLLTTVMVITSISQLSISSNDVTFTFLWSNDDPLVLNTDLGQQDTFSLKVWRTASKTTLLYQYDLNGDADGETVAPDMVKLPADFYYEYSLSVCEFNNPVPVTESAGSPATPQTVSGLSGTTTLPHSITVPETL